LRHLILITFFVTLLQQGKSQSTSTIIGGRAAGLAYASATLQDEWSIYNNVAGLASVTQTIVASSVEVKPKLQGANRSAFALTIPTSLGTLGAGAFRFGDELYHEQLVNIGFSNQLGIASLGASLNYIQYNAQGFGTIHLLTFSAGGIANLSKSVSIGASIHNINQPVLSEVDDEKVPTRLSFGLGITPTEKVKLCTELSKEVDQLATFKTGIEYKATKKFYWRTGFSLYPNQFFAGIGFAQSRLSIDYAYQYAFTGLGDSHQASLGYKWKGK
jgi:hypothetical protein